MVFISSTYNNTDFMFTASLSTIRNVTPFTSAASSCIRNEL